MNPPNPLVPQGTLERQSRGKSSVRIAIFTIVSIHAVFFAGLLMQGCRRDDGKATLKTAETATNQNALPTLDPSYYGATQELAQTSPPPSSPSTTPPTPAEMPSTLPPAPAAPEPASEGKTYTIVKGDSLARIARAKGTTVGALVKANPTLDTAKLRPGQKIQIPAGAPASLGLGFAEPSKADLASSAGGSHTVKAGETLIRIAKQHNTTLKALRAANNLKGNRLLVGQKLKLPAPQTASVGDLGKTAPKFSAANTAHTSSLAGNNLR